MVWYSQTIESFVNTCKIHTYTAPFWYLCYFSSLEDNNIQQIESGAFDGLHNVTWL